MLTDNRRRRHVVVEGDKAISDARECKKEVGSALLAKIDARNLQLEVLSESTSFDPRRESRLIANGEGEHARTRGESSLTRNFEKSRVCRCFCVR